MKTQLLLVHHRTQQFNDQPRPSPYTTASRSTSSIAVHNSFTINLVHRRTQQLHDQPRPSPYTTASRSTSSIAVHNSFTINLVHHHTQWLHDCPRLIQQSHSTNLSLLCQYPALLPAQHLASYANFHAFQYLCFHKPWV
ncbi:hypothetical protein ACLKA6_018947 [Drosophila palustris]